MMWMWISVAAAVIAGIYFTHDIRCLLALGVPMMVALAAHFAKAE